MTRFDWGDRSLKPAKVTLFVLIFYNPVSSEIPDLCETSHLLLFLSCFTSQNKEIKFGNYFSDVCCVT